MSEQSTASLIAQGAAAMREGKDVLGFETTSSESLGVQVDDGQVVTTQESTDLDLLQESEDTPSDSRDEEPASSEANQETSPTKEVITISDDKGRRKVEVDFSDKDKLRKYVQMAYGARKWQAERDQARQEVAQERQEKSDLKNNWEALENAYSNKGVEGVVDLIEGRAGAYKSWMEKQLERHEFLRSASPKELEAFQAREESDLRGKELERMRRENEQFRQQMEKEREQVELRSLESQVHPVFDKYRFADKLDNADDEHMFDEMLWNSALKRLEPYEEKGLPITQELVDREFRQVAMAIRKRIGLQAEKKASKTINQKKQEATENVQAKVMSGYKTSGTVTEARDLIQSGNLTKLLQNWGKYGKVFNS